MVFQTHSDCMFSLFLMHVYPFEDQNSHQPAINCLLYLTDLIQPLELLNKILHSDRDTTPRMHPYMAKHLSKVH